MGEAENITAFKLLAFPSAGLDRAHERRPVIGAGAGHLRMLHEVPIVFFWGRSEQEKRLVAASASSDSIEVYYALEHRCSGYATSCTVSSQTWFDDTHRYLVEEVLRE